MPQENLLKFPHSPQAKGRTSNFLNYFVTQRGRNLMGTVVAGIATCVSAAVLFSETYFLDNYIDIIRVYQNGTKVKVPEWMEEQIDAAVDKGKLSAREVAYLKSFMVSGFDVVSLGSIYTNSFGWIGIPFNYTYSSTADIDKFNIRLRTETIDWNGKFGQLLEESLILTEDERQFGLLKAAYETRNYNYVHKSLLPGLSLFSLYMLAQNVNSRFGLYQRPRFTRWFVYGVLATFSYGIYSLLTDTIRIQQDTQVDKSMAELGPEMCEAGVRFYEKLLNKNIALRELSGQDIYSAKGNEYPGFLRWTKLALTTRKAYLKLMLDEWKRKKSEKSGEPVGVDDNKQK